MAGRDRVAELFASLVPPGVAFAALPIAGDEPPLLPAEAAAIAGVAPRRRRTFAFGRACARRALGREVAIGIGPGGAPLWPAGIAGSITHTDDDAAAAVGAVRALGIDLESRVHAARTPDLAALVATTPHERAQPAALVFSAKESVYKCLYPTGGRFLDFADVELVFAAGTFTVVRAAGYHPREVRGRFVLTDELVASVAVLT